MLQFMGSQRVRHNLATEQQLYSHISEIIPSIPILQMIKLRSMNINQLVNVTELVTDSVCVVMNCRSTRKLIHNPRRQVVLPFSDERIEV